MQLPNPPAEISTSKTKLAACYLLFGLKLRTENPTFCADEVPRRDLQATPKRVVFYNFLEPLPETIDVRGVGIAFFGRDASEKLALYLESLPLDAQQKRELGGLISAQTAQACREVMEIREALVHLVQKKMPEEAKWDLIRWSPDKFTLIPKSASPELRKTMIERNDRH